MWPIEGIRSVCMLENRVTQITQEDWNHALDHDTKLKLGVLQLLKIYSKALYVTVLVGAQ